MKSRTATIKRDTAETKIRLSLNVDGSGKSDIRTGIGFFDHMLTLFSKHANMDLSVVCQGDLQVDYHHTVEDVGIALGSALKQALGDKKGIVRYGFFYLPMDETLTRVVLDLSNRVYLEYRVPGKTRKAGDFPMTLVEEFMRAFANNAAMNLHIELLYGRDAHHIAESVFKGLARALDMACRRDPRVKGLPSTKGKL
ncbi:MAG: imidazoleglycerol-phosphate dehydratase HisB [Candidatus Methylacidiphilales bacterium]|nr:imidazoleglycerol-phosphate dehydratase HisB [Candidatus Methylacidiphilales bacterium]